jgi:hypothetical protein
MVLICNILYALADSFPCKYLYHLSIFNPPIFVNNTLENNILEDVQQNNQQSDSIKYSTSKESSMLENIIETLSKPTLFGAGIVSGYIGALGLYQTYLSYKSPKLHTQAKANDYFQEIRDYYKIAPDELELRITVRGPTYIAKVEDKPIVFFNMNSMFASQNLMHHEVLHYLNGDLNVDPEEIKGMKEFKFWLKYLFVNEPRAIWKSRIEPIIRD